MNALLDNAAAMAALGPMVWDKGGLLERQAAALACREVEGAAALSEVERVKEASHA